MWGLIQKGGPLMWPLLLCSVLAVAFYLERLIYFRRQEIRTGDFLRAVINLVRRKQFAEAQDRCDEAHGPVAQVLHAALQHRTEPRAQLKEIVQEVAQLQVPLLEKRLPVLATIGYLAPLLGLLGTVTGMMQAFLQVQAKSGAATAADIAGGIWEALIATAAGLAVAIPVHAAHNFLVSRVNHFVVDMERAGIEIVQALTTNAPLVDFDPAPAPGKDGAGS